MPNLNLKLYNTFSKKIEKFTPLKKGQVKFYTCGPTVYDYASIGNMWSYLTADLLRRYLEYLGLKVKQIKNITDVGHFTADEVLEINGEDKMEKAAKREKKDPLELANYYTKFYQQDEKKLNIKKPFFQPRPTQEIAQIIKIIQKLVKNKHAYETSDGVYFSVKTFKKYGKLSGNSLALIKKGARIKINENKHDPADFALWIKRVGKNKNHFLHWNSPWGKGFPGWHIECTAMATKYLGNSIDIHTGGEDNIFPHHECEIAQSEAYSRKKFVKYWIHTRHFYVDGKKMSKSLQNVYTISQTPDNRFQSLEEMGFHPLVFRILKLQSHYRSKANFTLKAMTQAKKLFIFINDIYQKLKQKPQKKTLKTITLPIRPFIKQFEKALNNDLNFPLAFKEFLGFMKKINHSLIKEKNFLNHKEILKTILKIDSVFAILEHKKKNIPKTIQTLALQREQARKNKNFTLADQLRQKIEKSGFIILDTKTGFQIKTK